MMIQLLNWDTEFFGKRIARYDFNENHFSLVSLKSELYQEDIELLYVFSLDRIPILEQIGIYPVDEKVVFSKTVSDMNLSGLPTGVEDYHGEITEQLQTLALASGEFSRFKIDPVMAPQFKRFYLRWLNESLARRMADYFLIHQTRHAITGFVTARSIGKTMSIGLIATDRENRGKGIGSTLIEAVESCCYQRGISSLEVPTQRDNSLACAFYRRNGFHEKSFTFIYHVHREMLVKGCSH